MTRRIFSWQIFTELPLGLQQLTRQVDFCWNFRCFQGFTHVRECPPEMEFLKRILKAKPGFVIIAIHGDI